jgi:recombination protein RecA
MSDANLKTITKKYGNILVNGAEVFQDLKNMQTIPVSPALDYSLGGGFREGTWIQMIGDPKSGKTTLALQFAATCQKEEYGNRPIFYVNVEGRLSTKNFEGIEGLQADKITVVQADNETLSAEQYLGAVEKLVKAHPNCVVIIDSISSLIAQRDLDEEVRGDYRPGVPRILSNFCKKMSSVVPKQKAIIIMVTHFIANTGGMGKKKVADGGVKVRYQADTILEIAWIQPWKEKNDGRQIGQVLHWKIVTSALGGFTGGEATGWLRYGTGIDFKQEMFDQANDFDLISAAGAWYTCDFLVDEPQLIKKILEEAKIDIEDEEKIIKFVKFQGQQKLRDFLTNNDLWPTLQNSLKEMLS